jgi:hypothetical protein
VIKKAPQPAQLDVLPFEPMPLAHADQVNGTRRNSGNRSGSIQTSTLRSLVKIWYARLNDTMPIAGPLYMRLRIAGRLIARLIAGMLAGFYLLFFLAYRRLRADYSWQLRVRISYF